MLSISYGRTILEKKLAEKIGDRKLVKAVGRAITLNFIHINVPCHRIIGTNGSLFGYSGGIEIRRFLLELEVVLQKNSLDKKEKPVIKLAFFKSIKRYPLFYFSYFVNI